MNFPLLMVSLVALGVSAGVAVWLVRRRGTRWPLALEAAGVLLTGLIHTFFSTGHLAGITVERFTGEWAHRYSHRIPPGVVWILGFPYDLRFYLMALFAIVMLVEGVKCLRSVSGIAANDRGARAAALGATASLVAITVPVYPWAHVVQPLLAASALAGITIAIGRLKTRPSRVRVNRLVAAAWAGR